MTDHAKLERATGALVGAVVGDALGAPFEFGPAGAFSETHPSSRLLEPTEMTGSRTWEPGEWTDDTQMALLIAQSLLERDGLDEADIFDRFQHWARGRPKDIGIQTSMVLLPGADWRHSAADHFAATGHAAGNGSLMRTVPAAIYFAEAGRTASMDAARRISALTHGDPAAGEGCAIYHELIRLALEGQDPLDHIDEVLSLVPGHLRAEWAARLDPAYDPRLDPIGNGAVWPALGAAVWALRTTTSFEDALRAVIDLGGDTDTLACITGGLVGARHSIGAIPSRWTIDLHGSLIGRAIAPIDVEELEAIAHRLLTNGNTPSLEGPPEAPIEPTLVWADQHIYASNLSGVVLALNRDRLPDGAVVISLSRTFGRLEDHALRRQAWLIDQSTEGRNLAIHRVLDDVIDTIEAARLAGRPVVVHCHAGRSRTGLVLRAWQLRQRPELSVAEATAEVRWRWPHLDTWNGSFDTALETWTVPSKG